jgi:hypothetical protein
VFAQLVAVGSGMDHSDTPDWPAQPPYRRWERASERPSIGITIGCGGGARLNAMPPSGGAGLTVNSTFCPP